MTSFTGQRLAISGDKENDMNARSAMRRPILAAVLASNLSFAACTFAADIKGQVLGGGAAIAQSTVTLMQASAGAPKQLAQTKSDGSGNFAIHGTGAPDFSLYLVAMGGVPAANKAAGDNPAIALIAVLGSRPPARVVISEMTRS